LILSACRDAGIRPTQIAYVECHGTGTKIGDPIEISALKDTVARDRKEICYLGSVKSNLGHLESAAGIAGLIKSLAVLNHGIIPPNLHFLNPNEYIDFESHNLRVVTEETSIDPLAHIGISSFGFGGSNAHIIVKGVGAAVRKKIKPGKVPFDRERAVPLGQYLRLVEPEAASPPADRSAEAPADPEGTRPEAEASGGGSDNHPEEAVTRNAVDKMVGKLIFELANIEKIDPDVELIDQGLDSLSGTELISQLEILLGVEISPDLLLENPLPTQFVDQVYALAAGLRN
jgi:acyl carrier protein